MLDDIENPMVLPRSVLHGPMIVYCPNCDQEMIPIENEKKMHDHEYFCDCGTTEVWDE